MRQGKTIKRMAAYLAAMTVCLGMTQNTDAQDIKVKVPVSTRFVEVTSEGVNVRRLPNATSGKIMTWHSDAGSIDTYTKIFYSDTESGKYRPNRNTGAYIDAFHPYKGDKFIMASANPTLSNGWYNVIVDSEENAKLGWIKSDFCGKPIEMVRDGSSDGLSFPISFTWDGENDRSIPGKLIKPNEGGFQRGTGKYAKLRLHISGNEQDQLLSISTAVTIDGFTLVARSSIGIVLDEEMTSKFALEEMENDMGDYGELVIKLKSGQDMVKNAVFNLIKSPDSVFQLLVDNLFPGGKFPTDEVYIKTKSGEKKQIGFGAYDVDNEFKTYTLHYDR